MAAAHIDNITGSELYAEHAGKYHDAESAAAYLASLGVDRRCRRPSCRHATPLGFNPRMAQRGDVVNFNTDLGPALGVVDLSGTKIIGSRSFGKGFYPLPLRAGHGGLARLNTAGVSHA